MEDIKFSFVASRSKYSAFEIKKMNLKLINNVSKLLQLLIFFVILFLVSTILYSARYWPDVYNYINANITITRIPTLKELNPTILSIDYTTESTTQIDGMSTTDWYETSTSDYLFDGNYSAIFDEEFDYFLPIENRRKREAVNINQDFVLLPNKTVIVDYFFDYDYEERDKVKVKSLLDGGKRNDGTVKEKYNLKFKIIHNDDTVSRTIILLKDNLIIYF